jgi:hypothetical protein
MRTKIERLGIMIIRHYKAKKIAEIRQRQEESDKRFEVLLSEVRYLIRQIKPDDRQSQS